MKERNYDVVKTVVGILLAAIGFCNDRHPLPRCENFEQVGGVRTAST